MPNNLDDLYMLYMKDVYRYLLFLCNDHYTAEDLVQETFTRAYLYLEQYEGEKVKPWLFRVAHNAFIDATRKTKRSIPHDDRFFIAKLSSEDSPELKLLLQERLSELGDAIAKLPEKQRQALLLHDWHELTYQESADVMGIGLSYFKVLLYRARQSLRHTHKEGMKQ